MRPRPAWPLGGSEPLRRLLLSLFSPTAAVVTLGAGCGGVSETPASVGDESHFPGIEPGAGTADHGGTSSAPPLCEQCLALSGVEWQDHRLNALPLPWPRSILSPCSGYWHDLTIEVGTDYPLPRCSAPVDCPSATFTALNAILLDPEMPRSYGPGDRRKLSYGLSADVYADSFWILLPRSGPRPAEYDPYDPDAYPALGLFVGSPCNGAPDCDEIPPLIDSLVQQLHAIDARELAKQECASSFPNGPGY